MTALLLALALAAGAPGFTPDSLARPITLDQAIAMAQKNAPAIVQAIGQQRNAAAGVRSAAAAFIPSLTLSAGATRQVPSAGAATRVDNNGQVITLPDEPWSNNLGLIASVGLFEGGRRLFELRQARANAGAAAFGVVQQDFAIRLSVQQQFFNILADLESVDAAQSQLEQAQRQLVASLAQVRAHTATRSDSLRGEIQVRNAQVALIDARVALQVDNATLTRSVGSRTLVTAAPLDSTERLTLGLSDADILRLAGQGPTVKSAESALAAARAARNSAWANYLPTISASYSRSGSGTSDKFQVAPDNLSYTGSLRFSLSMPVFDQLQREASVTAAQVTLANAEASLRDAQLGAQESALQALGAHHSAQERVSAQTVTLAAAQEDLRVQQQRYALGESTLLDVLTSQSALDTARHDLIRARYDLRVARAQLEALLGRAL
jgi:outer membrane protein